jgi:hypothetical protein
MKTYVITTGAIFGLLTLAHLWRMTVERHLASDPWYLVITVGTAVLCFWAWRVARVTPRS